MPMSSPTTTAPLGLGLFLSAPTSKPRPPSPSSTKPPSKIAPSVSKSPKTLRASPAGGSLTEDSPGAPGKEMGRREVSPGHTAPDALETPAQGDPRKISPREINQREKRVRGGEPPGERVEQEQEGAPRKGDPMKRDLMKGDLIKEGPVRGDPTRDAPMRGAPMKGNLMKGDPKEIASIVLAKMMEEGAEGKRTRKRLLGTVRKEEKEADSAEGSVVVSAVEDSADADAVVSAVSTEGPEKIKSLLSPPFLCLTSPSASRRRP